MRISWWDQQHQRNAYVALSRAVHNPDALRQVSETNAYLFFGAPMMFIAQECATRSKNAEHAQVLCLGRALVALSYLHNVRAEDVVSAFRVFKFAVEWLSSYLRIDQDSEAEIVVGLLQEVRVALRTFGADAIKVVPPFCRHIHGLVKDGRDCSDEELLNDIRNI